MGGDHMGDMPPKRRSCKHNGELCRRLQAAADAHLLECDEGNERVRADASDLGGKAFVEPQWTCSNGTRRQRLSTPARSHSHARAFCSQCFQDAVGAGCVSDDARA